MPFQCPECKNQNTLNITYTIELPADSRSDEIALQTIRCNLCNFYGIATYEESRRGSLQDEAYEHLGFQTSKDTYDDLVKLLHKCPDPNNAHCPCAIHLKLGNRDGTGRWSGISQFKHHGGFLIKTSIR